MTKNLNFRYSKVKIFMFKYIYFLLLLFSSCTSFKTTRILTEAEKSRYNLNGIINEARICPNLYDEGIQGLKVSGACEVVSCKELNNKILCTAIPE